MDEPSVDDTSITSVNDPAVPDCPPTACSGPMSTDFRDFIIQIFIVLADEELTEVVLVDTVTDRRTKKPRAAIFIWK